MGMGQIPLAPVDQWDITIRIGVRLSMKMPMRAPLHHLVLPPKPPTHPPPNPWAECFLQLKGETGGNSSPYLLCSQRLGNNDCGMKQRAGDKTYNYALSSNMGQTTLPGLGGGEGGVIYCNWRGRLGKKVLHPFSVVGAPATTSVRWNTWDILLCQNRGGLNAMLNDKRWGLKLLAHLVAESEKMTAEENSPKQVRQVNSCIICTSYGGKWWWIVKFDHQIWGFNTSDLWVHTP